MADGSVVIDTELDQSGLKKGLSKMASTVSDGLKGSLSKITSVIGDTLVSAFEAAGVAIAGATTAIVNIGSEYESQMSRVQAISGATTEELEALDAQAKQLGGDTVFSASEVAEGMENLASAGFSVTEIMDAMPGMLDLAAVSGGDLANASEVASTALNAFGLEASEAGHVADVFAQAAADTNAEVADMGEAMKYIAPVASSMGLSIEETAAAIGILSDNGIKGSQAGTTLRSALSRLSKPTDEMQTLMDELGISFYDSEGNMVSLSEQVSILENAFVGMTDEEKNNALVTLYGQESLSGMLALIEEGPEALSEMTASFENCDGAAESMADTMLNNLSGAIENLSGSAETLGLSIYDDIKQPLTEAVNLADSYLGELQDAFDAGGLEGLVSAAGDVLAEALNDIVSYIPPFANTAVELVTSFVSGIVDNIPTVAEAAAELGMSLLDGVSNILPLIVEGYMDIVIELANAINDNAPMVLEAVTSLIDGLSQSITNNLPSLQTAVTSVISLIITCITENLPTMVNTAVQIGMSLLNGLTSVLPMLLEGAAEVVTQLANGIAESAPSIISTITTLITSLSETISNNISPLLEAVISVINAVLSEIGNNLPTIIESV